MRMVKFLKTFVPLFQFSNDCHTNPNETTLVFALEFENEVS